MCMGEGQVQADLLRRGAGSRLKRRGVGGFREDLGDGRGVALKVVAASGRSRHGGGVAQDGLGPGGLSSWPKI